MPKLLIPAVVEVLSLFCSLTFSQSIASLSQQDEIRAGEALFISFQKSQGFADTPESKTIEQYLQKIGDKIAQHAQRKLPYKFHLDRSEERRVGKECRS